MPTVKVMIVDDSVVIRRLLTDVLSAEPGIEVALTASNGQIALTKLQTAQVDIVVLDIEMPEMDGLQTLREIRKRNRRLPVIMFSTLTEFGARATLDALSAGASDYVTKPANVGSVSESREAVRTQLVPKVLALAGAQPAAPTALVGGPRTLPPLPHRHEIAPRIARPDRPLVRPRVLVVGSSTGGPEALNRLIPRLPADLAVPVLIVQHMPPLFTTMLAERLNRMSTLTVVESVGSEPLEAGKVYLAPGDLHLEIAAVGSRSKYCSSLTKAAPENFCRPSVDVLFRSAARTYGASVLGVVLTGMGSDGRAGAQKIVEAGGNVIVQDRDTSVVWGMPGAVAAGGLADEVLPLDLIASAIVRRLADGVEPIPARTA